MRRLVDAWNRFWFSPSSTLNLAGARIVALAFGVWMTLPGLQGSINLAVKNSTFVEPQPMIRLIAALVPRDAIVNPETLTLIHRLTVAAGVLALVGLFTRTSLFAFALGLSFFVSHAYSYADVHHREALYVLFLFALALAPAGERLSLDAVLRRWRSGTDRQSTGTDWSDMAGWPLKLLHVLLAMTYFSTGITKLMVGGLRWMNGYTLQKYIFITGINRDIPLGVWVAHQHTLCVLLAVGTILFETFYFISLLAPRTAPFFFAGGILFHVSLYVMAGHPFFEHILLNAILLLFLNTGWLPSWLGRGQGKLDRPLAREPAQLPT